MRKTLHTAPHLNRCPPQDYDCDNRHVTTSLHPALLAARRPIKIVDPQSNTKRSGTERRRQLINQPSPHQHSIISMEFPLANIILFRPIDPHASLAWKSRGDAIFYLLTSPAARQDLLDKVQELSQGTPQNFIIVHSQIRRGIILHTDDDDLSFLRILQSKLLLESHSWMNIPGLEPDLR